MTLLYSLMKKQQRRGAIEKKAVQTGAQLAEEHRRAEAETDQQRHKRPYRR